MNYFTKFPQIFYSFPDKTGYETFQRIVTDITQNVRARKEIFEDILLYDEYDIEDNDTPEIIAEKLYGNMNLHWVIMIANQRYDYIRDFPLSQSELEEFIRTKYGVDNMYKLHHYEKNGIEVQPEGYFNIPSSMISNFQAGDRIFTHYSLPVDTTLFHVSETTDTSDETDDISSGLFAEIIFVEESPSRIWVKLYMIDSSIEEHLCTLNRNGANVYSFTLLNNTFKPADRYVPITNYDYEVSVNESKRRLKIINAALIPQLLSEFSKLMGKAGNAI